MATIDDVAARHRAQVLAAERRAAGRILRTWANAADTIRRELAALQDRIAAAQAAGIPVSPDWLRREDRFRTLLATTEQQMRTLVAATEQTLYGSGRTAVRLALEHAGEHIAASTPWATFSALDVAAVEAAVGLTSPSSPLRVILREMARDVPGATAQRIADRLTAGITLGQNPRKVAALIAQDLDGQRARALTVARTEMMRAYRTATLEGYRLQADLLTGWVWYSALDGRTCAACWSMHGKRFPLNEEMGSHPNCRCTMLPDLPDVDPVPDGADQFATLPPDAQLAILGPAKFDAYQAGALTLDDLVQVRRSSLWGTTRSEASLVGVLGPEGAQRHYAAARTGR